MTHSLPSRHVDRPRSASARRATVWSPMVIAAWVGLAAGTVGLAVEEAIVRIVRGNRRELEWLSDAVISLAVAGIAYLWLHLRASRMRLLALEREQIVIGEQLRLAAEIQRNLLPDVPLSTPGYAWAARMMPAGLIGGDFYDFIQTADGAVVAVLADVSGKGIPAALILSSLKTLFRSTVRETTDPAAIAGRISAALFEEHSGSPYATGIIARFETAPVRLTYVNAGHPPGCLFHDGTVMSELASGGPPLGLFPEAGYAAADVTLNANDIGVLVTDGITEAVDAWPTVLGRLLIGSPERSGAATLPAEVCGSLLRAAADGPGPAGVPDWQDDRSVLVFRIEADV